MQLCDVNILVYAHREDSGSHVHEACRSLLETLVNGDAAYGVSELVLSGFMRIVTHPKVFARPSTLDEALTFAKQLRDPHHAVPIVPGARHWAIFDRLCRESAAKGNLVPDAYLAALAIEAGCEWVTTDRDYARFNGLRLRHLRAT